MHCVCTTVPVLAPVLCSRWCTVCLHRAFGTVHGTYHRARSCARWSSHQPRYLTSSGFESYMHGKHGSSRRSSLSTGRSLMVMPRAISGQQKIQPKMANPAKREESDISLLDKKTVCANARTRVAFFGRKYVVDI